MKTGEGKPLQLYTMVSIKCITLKIYVNVSLKKDIILQDREQ